MEIFNRPPAISEDTLQYALHPPPNSSDKNSVTALATLLLDYAESLLPGQIWHRDALEMKVVPEVDGDAWFLEGKMRVGDCVDDEWCVVWLMNEITTKWDLTVTISDSDGEFLLIEAAEFLPTWVTPTNAENRVWIYNSRLHLIPLSHVSAPSSKRIRRRRLGAGDSDDERDVAELSDEDFINLVDAVKLVRDPGVHTLAPVAVEKVIRDKILGYPGRARDNLHIAKTHLPVDIAQALLVNVGLVQKAVEAFYTRDAVQLRAAHRMLRFPPEPSVLTTVKMTRAAYAQLVGQKFHPPKIFGKWRETEGTKEWRWRDVGMKIACGFEMLYQESKGQTDAQNTASTLKASAVARKEALRRSTDYIEYIKRLQSVGYFKGEQEGSQKWNSLEIKAVEAFLKARRDDDASRPSFAALVNEAVAQATASPLGDTHEEEESDDWLNVDAEDFEGMLQSQLGTSQAYMNTHADAMDVDGAEEKKGGESDNENEDRLAKEQAKKLESLAKKVEEFVDGQGTLEGARFDDDILSDEEFSDDELESESGNEISNNEQEAARQAALDKLVPSLEPSEYGKMPPSFYINSQPVSVPTIDSEVADIAQTTATATNNTTRIPTRRPVLPRDQFDGVVDSDDETDEEGGEFANETGGMTEEEDSDEDKPQIVGEVEVDMGEEQEDFIRFSRQTLGISDEQWGDILRDRKDRGVFVPNSALKEENLSSYTGAGAASGLRAPAAGSRPNANPNLDSFEAVMLAMDAELARSKKGSNKKSPAQKNASSADKGKGRATMPAVDEDEEDAEGLMDAELRAALNRSSSDDSDEEEPIDYNLIKNFLESFKSQSGLPGPVSNLAGRLQPGWKLPRDES